MFMCSDPGQNHIKDAIQEHKLDGVIVAACSPTLHESTFQTVMKESGLNEYQMEIANIREQCSWVHNDIEQATHKARLIIKTAIEKLKLNESLYPVSAPVTKESACYRRGNIGHSSSSGYCRCRLQSYYG